MKKTVLFFVSLLLLSAGPVLAEQIVFVVIRDFSDKLGKDMDTKVDYFRLKSIQNNLAFGHPVPRYSLMDSEELQMNFTEKNAIKEDSVRAGLSTLMVHFWETRMVRRIHGAIGGLNLRISKNASKGTIEVLAPSLSRPIDPFDAQRDRIKLEKRIYGGDDPQAEGRRIALEKELDELGKERRMARPLDIRVGFVSQILRDREEGTLVFEYGPKVQLNLTQFEGEVKYVTAYDLNHQAEGQPRIEGVLTHLPFKTSTQVSLIELYYLDKADYGNSSVGVSVRRLIGHFALFTTRYEFLWREKHHKETVTAESLVSKNGALIVEAAYVTPTNNAIRASYRIKF
ncbi:MAG: hypothetical protein AABY46_02260 [Nitrospirota bacterium]